MAVTATDIFQLVSVKAVEAGYPLKGDLLISEAPYGPIERSGDVPPPGEIWLAPRLYSLLEVAVGDSLWIGDAELTITGTVRREPDATSGTYGYGPRVLMNLADIDATGVVQPGSRVSWRLLLSGKQSTLDSFTQWLEPQLGQAIGNLATLRFELVPSRPDWQRYWLWPWLAGWLFFPVVVRRRAWGDAAGIVSSALCHWRSHRTGLSGLFRVAAVGPLECNCASESATQ
ncbi:MAG: hypothetical protein EBY62_09185 [Cellvibrionales bacterium]|nr:hypothetical protein [Cellvibrionales bacterium]